MNLRSLILVLGTGLLARPARAQDTDPAVLSLRRIYASADFRSESYGPARWFPTGTAYTTLEASTTGGGKELVRYDAATGAREVLVTAARLTPPGATAPLVVENYEWSPDQARLLVFTNSKPVWRLNTRGDYWVLDRASGQLRQLGKFAKPSTLMYAKFSPDGGRVGYVVENNLFVEEIATGQVTQLTRDGSRTIINGNFDWVYEEELSLHDGWRWSPDGTRVAYWQLNADRVRDFGLIRTTDSLYSSVVPIQYPKAGRGKFRGPDRRRECGGWRNDLARHRRRSRATTISPAWTGRPRASSSWCSGSTGCRTPSTSCWRMRVPERSRRSWWSTTAPGSMSWTTWSGSKAASASPGSASATGGPTCTSSLATGGKRSWSPRAISTSSTSSAPTTPTSGSTTSPRPTTPRSAISGGHGSTAAARPSGSPRQPSPGSHGYNAGPGMRWAFHTYHTSPRLPPPSWSSCPRIVRCGPSRATRRCASA